MRVLLLAAVLAVVTPAFPSSAHAGETRFYPVEIFIDAGEARLGAWQAELTFPAGRIAIVGLEGGDAPFVEAPYHDPRGLEAGRVIIAAFTLGPLPPTGRVRVGRIHLMDRGGSSTPIKARLIVAADPDGNEIEARIDVTAEKGRSR